MRTSRICAEPLRNIPTLVELIAETRNPDWKRAIMKLFAALLSFGALMVAAACTGYGAGEYPDIYGGSYYSGYSDGNYYPYNQGRGVRVCNELGCGRPEMLRRSRRRENRARPLLL
jgi:hypothetical protein